MPDNNMALATDPKIVWRAAKLFTENLARELGINLSDIPATVWLKEKIRGLVQGVDLPNHWFTSTAGVLAGAYAQSPKSLAKYFSQLTGLDEVKVDRLFNEGLDAGILAFAVKVEKDLNHPADATSTPKSVRDAINQTLARMKGEGKFKNLQPDGKDLLSVIAEISQSGDEKAEALARNFTRVYASANAHRRATLEGIGQQPVWNRQVLRTVLMNSVPEGAEDVNLDTFITLMKLKTSEGKVGRAVSFVGAALTGDRNNPDFHEVLESVDQMTGSLREGAQRLNAHADRLEGRRYRKPPSAREQLAMFGRRLVRWLNL